MDIIEIFMWIGWAAFASVTIILVYMILAWIWPARNSAARFFIKGRRTNMPVVALDDGSRWIFKVAEKQAPGMLIDDEGQPIDVTPKSLKWGGGVYFGAGEYFRSKIANISVVDFLAKAKAEGYTQAKLSRLIKIVDNTIKEMEDQNVRKEERKPEPNSEPDGPDTEG